MAKDIRGQSTVARETTKVIQLLIIGFQINMVEIWTTTIFLNVLWHIPSQIPKTANKVYPFFTSE